MKHIQQKDDQSNIEHADIPLIIREKIVQYMGDVGYRKYERGCFLGEGGFAKCFEYKNIETGKVYAGKVIKKSTLPKKNSRARIISEIKIHKELYHSNIVRFETAFEDNEHIYIMIELCANQTLLELLQKRKKLSEIEVRYYALQIVSALKYLHSKRIIHRDIKLENLFLSKKLELKLGDFGLAAKLDFITERRTSICGTPQYIAPEVLENNNGYSFEVDIWSVGVIIYALLYGINPFECHKMAQTCLRIKKCSYFFPEKNTVSEEAKDLISKIFILDPSKRLTLDEIQSHPFFTNNCYIPNAMPLCALTKCPSEYYIQELISKPASENHKKVEDPSSPTATNISNKACQEFQGIELINVNTNTNLQKVQADEAQKREEIKIDYHMPKMYVSSWLDLSAKYGLGYLLSNGSIGVFFNDHTIIILDPSGNKFDYIEKSKVDMKSIRTSHTINEHPQELNKKIFLLTQFKSHFEKGGNTIEKTCEIDELVYIKKWKSTKHAMILKLNNNFLQVEFIDRTRLIFNSESKTVLFSNKRGEFSEHLILEAINSNNLQLKKRMKYAIESLDPSHIARNQDFFLQQTIQCVQIIPYIIK